MITAAACSRPEALNWTVLKRNYDYWPCTLPVITICRVFEWIIMGYATCSTLRQTFTASKSWDDALIAITLSAKHFLCCPAPGSITSPLLPASTGNSVMLTKKNTSRPIFKWVWNLCVPPLTPGVKHNHDCVGALGAQGHRLPSCGRWNPAMLRTSRQLAQRVLTSRYWETIVQLPLFHGPFQQNTENNDGTNSDSWTSPKAKRWSAVAQKKKNNRLDRSECCLSAEDWSRFSVGGQPWASLNVRMLPHIP